MKSFDDIVASAKAFLGEFEAPRQINLWTKEFHFSSFTSSNFQHQSNKVETVAHIDIYSDTPLDLRKALLSLGSRFQETEIVAHDHTLSELCWAPNQCRKVLIQY